MIGYIIVRIKLIYNLIDWNDKTANNKYISLKKRTLGVIFVW